MRYLPATALLILLLISFSFASVQWSKQTASAINGDVAIFANNAVFSSYSGTIYGFSLGSGSVSWTYSAGEKTLPMPIVVNSTSLAFATVSGQVIFLDASGMKTNSFNLSYPPQYIANGDGRLYVSSNDSVSAYNYAGTMQWRTLLNDSKGPLGYSGGRLYFTGGGRLYSLAASSGNINWAVPAEDSFLSVPSLYDDKIYFGATNGRLYAFNAANGHKEWDYRTDGWVMSTPSQLGSAIFFGSNDGYLYSLSSTGNLLNKFKAGGAIWTKPLFYANNGSTLAVFGSNDGKLYGVDSSTGKEVWSFSAGGRLGSAVESNGAFIFGTSQGKAYAVSPSPICSFSWPLPQERIGDWHVGLEGIAYSDSGVKRVEVRAGNGNWMAASGTEGWHATLDFSGTPTGPVEVQCRATDNAGKTESGTFSSITLVKTTNAPLKRMFVSAPSGVAANESFNISVVDERGLDMYGVSLTLDGEVKKAGDSPFSIVLGKAAPVQMLVEKEGYEPVSLTVAGQGGGNFLAGIIIVVLVMAAFAAYLLFGKRLLAKKG